MSLDQFIGEIGVFAFDFPPKGWATCAGQLLPIPQHTALFSLLGTQFGGDGVRTFALPDLRGRAALSDGTGAGLSQRAIGDTMGAETITLSAQQLASHKHAFRGADADTSKNVYIPDSTTVVARAVAVDSAKKPIAIQIYAQDPAPSITMAPQSIGISGGGQPHNNMMPYVTLNVCIAMEGIYPQ
jgi:microcystin-dependent protein